ncbi:MAG: phage tail protein [Azonexaceae bacterium]|nr:phage tail protein [Azonexaceae bacterium]
MSEPYVGEIRMFAGNFAPNGWAFCDGQMLSIADNEVLFALIGTTYGGDGQVTYALPDLRGRVPVHAGGGHVIGEKAGSETVTLTANQMPAHTHGMQASALVSSGSVGPSGNVPGASSASMFYGDTDPTVAMHPSAITLAGGSQPHNNMAPYLGINFIISLFGVFPSPS